MKDRLTTKETMIIETADVKDTNEQADIHSEMKRRKGGWRRVIW